MYYENSLNLKIANDILSDKQREWLFWNDFSLISYDKNYDYIITNYPEHCIDEYIHAINQMKIANEINRTINQNAIWQKDKEIANILLNQINFKKYKEEHLDHASTTKVHLEYLLTQKCS